MIFRDDNKTLILHVDVGDAWTRGSSPMDRRVGARFVHRGDDELTELEENLDRLTLDISDTTIDDLPRRFQIHTTGVSVHFICLLCRVERAIIVVCMMYP